MEVHERLDAKGNIVQDLDESRLEKDLEVLSSSEIDSLAIVLMHSWKNSIHEDRCYEIAKKVGFTNVSISSRLMPTIKIVGRGQTTVVDSYLSPVLREYILFKKGMHKNTIPIHTGVKKTINIFELYFFQKSKIKYDKPTLKIIEKI